MHRYDKKALVAGSVVAAALIFALGFGIVHYTGEGKSSKADAAASCDTSALIDQAKAELLQTTKSGVWYSMHLGTPGFWTDGFNLLDQAKGCGSTTTTAPTTTAPTTAPTTTAAPPPGSSPPEFSFPGTPGAVGSALPGHACADPSPSSNCSQEGGFNRSDYEGWATGTNGRMKWVADPSGSGKTVAQFDVFGSDDADQFGGTRTSLWRNADNCTGCEAWQAWGTYIPSNFSFPDGWFLTYQDFSSGGNPAQAVELRNAACSGSPGTELCWKDQTATSSGQHYFPLGQAQPGHWFYIVEDIKFLNTSAGFDKVWYAVDHLPDTSLSPAVNWNGITAYTTGANRSNIFMYRSAGVSTQHQTIMFCGFHRAATAATAKLLPDCPL